MLLTCLSLSINFGKTSLKILKFHIFSLANEKHIRAEIPQQNGPKPQFPPASPHTLHTFSFFSKKKNRCSWPRRAAASAALPPDSLAALRGRVAACLTRLLPAPRACLLPALRRHAAVLPHHPASCHSRAATVEHRPMVCSGWLGAGFGHQFPWPHPHPWFGRRWLATLGKH